MNVLAAVSSHDAVFWVAVLIIVGCLVAAGVAAFRGLWLPVALLVVVALFTGIILLS